MAAKLISAIPNETDIAVVRKGKTRNGKPIPQLVEFPAWGVIDTGEKDDGETRYQLLPFLPTVNGAYYLSNTIPSFLFTMTNSDDEKSLLREARAVIAEMDEDETEDDDDLEEEEEEPDESEEEEEEEPDEEEDDDDDDSPAAHIRSK
ncbi:MAG: hypothetical protein WC565_04230 [Parcubacteria group bacterium]